MKFWRLFRMTKSGTVPHYQDLPAEVKQALDWRRDKIQFIEEQRRIVVRLEDTYLTWQHNPLKEEWVLVREERLA